MEDLSRFFRMMLDCYGLFGWEFDAAWNVLDANSPSQYLHSLLLLGKGNREALDAYAQGHTMPLIVSDSLGLMWACVFGGVPHAGHRFVLGPAFTGEVSAQAAEQLVAPLNLSIRDKWAMIDCLQRIPSISTVVFFQQAAMLHYCVTGQAVQSGDFGYLAPMQEDAAKPEETPHSPVLVEKKLLDMVRTGNLEYRDVLSAAAASSPGIRISGSDPIRQAKYSVVAFTVLCSRAAMEGGLSSELAYALCDAYAESVDRCDTISQIAAVSHTMYQDFIERVNRHRRVSGVTRPVQVCCDYIDTHPTSELKLETLAEKTGYTGYYLTRKFKQEMGISLNKYIRAARLSYAKVLLAATTVPIQEISEQLHFCSRSYFSEVFRQAEGMLPSEFRTQRQRESNAE